MRVVPSPYYYDSHESDMWRQLMTEYVAELEAAVPRIFQDACDCAVFAARFNQLFDHRNYELRDVYDSPYDQTLYALTDGDRLRIGAQEFYWDYVDVLFVRCADGYWRLADDTAQRCLSMLVWTSPEEIEGTARAIERYGALYSADRYF